MKNLFKALAALCFCVCFIITAIMVCSAEENSESSEETQEEGASSDENAKVEPENIEEGETTVSSPNKNTEGASSDDNAKGEPKTIEDVTSSSNENAENATKNNVGEGTPWITDDSAMEDDIADAALETEDIGYGIYLSNKAHKNLTCYVYNNKEDEITITITENEALYNGEKIFIKPYIIESDEYKEILVKYIDSNGEELWATCLMNEKKRVLSKIEYLDEELSLIENNMIWIPIKYLEKYNPPISSLGLWFWLLFVVGIVALLISIAPYVVMMFKKIDENKTKQREEANIKDAEKLEQS